MGDTPHWVHKFACGSYCGSVSFDSPERAQAFAKGYRAAADDTCSPVAAYAATELKMMQDCESAEEVVKATCW